MAKRKRDVPVLFWVSAEELELIHQKMQQYGTENLSAYLRKMAVDGYVVQLDLPELKELVSLMRYSSNNLNQLTLLWSSIFVTLMANKIGGLQFGIYRNCQISSRVFHTAVAALPLTKANRSDFE